MGPGEGVGGGGDGDRGGGEGVGGGGEGVGGGGEGSGEEAGDMGGGGSGGNEQIPPVEITLLEESMNSNESTRKLFHPPQLHELPTGGSPAVLLIVPQPFLDATT